MKMDGFSLIELMIGSFILALGLLGLAGVQSTAGKSMLEVQQRALANSLVVEISERMLLNRVWLEDNTDNDYAIASLLDAELAIPACITEGAYINCSGAEIRNNDLKEWQDKFLGIGAGTNSGLIEADACIESPDAEGYSTVVISWSSTVKSTDGADNDILSASYRCGEASTSRRQIMATVYSGGSS